MSQRERQSRIAIVIPWFGRDLRGGAELQAWNLATRLTARGYSIEVLTTCCGSFQDDWSSNRYSPGIQAEPEGFEVRRFPVEPRDRPAFDRVCGHLLSLDVRTLKPGVSPISPEDERIFCEHLIRCPALLSHLADEGWRYSAFIFLPYLYGPILDGLPLVASRAFLQPCLHDEAYAYLRCVQTTVFAARGLLWLSEGEYALGRRLFGPAVLAKSVVGMAGVEPLFGPTERQPDPSLLDLKPFVLLLGRKDAGKGTFLAIEAFKKHHIQSGSSLRLVVAGPGDNIASDQNNNIHDLGLVSEQQRSWLLCNAVALLQPSPNESFSRVMFEAWQCSLPVIVRRSCLATACAVQASQGGWLAETTEEWTRRIGELEALTSQQLQAIGAHGAAYTAKIADWSRVMERYDDVLQTSAATSSNVIRVRCTFTALQPQRIRLYAANRKLGEWDLPSGEVLETGWLEQNLPGSGEPSLEFVSSHSGSVYAPDPRTLGFHLKDLEAEFCGATVEYFQFRRGWNRSEGQPGISVPRWSTGSAQIAICLNPTAGSRQAIHQVLPNLGYGDAIGNHTLWIRDRLQSFGYSSEIFARHISPEMLHQAHPLCAPQSLPGDAAIIYHHSIGTEITPWVCQHRGPKALIYHNITPAEFFTPYSPDFAEILRHGREELPLLAPHFPVSVGDSRFNANELVVCGFDNPEVLPLCIDPAHWSFPPDEKTMSKLQDGRTNILFVGRIAPNKRHEDLIYTLKFWLEDDPEARLFLVGTAEVSSLYLECLQELARRLRVDHAVHFVGHVNYAQLHAYYRCASMFWCFSEHEGFCVPLIEACAFGLPVIARAEGAVAETLGDAGVLLPSRLNPVETVRKIASAWKMIDPTKMNARIANYSALNVTRRLQSMVDKLINSNPPFVR